jgi:hypothetical protein
MLRRVTQPLPWVNVFDLQVFDTSFRRDKMCRPSQCNQDMKFPPGDRTGHCHWPDEAFCTLRFRFGF